MIMIGPGTGLAPFVGFMQERHHLLENNGSELAHAHLFFGCRKSDCDFIYREDIELYQKKGVISKAHIAFSREKGVQKTYVQDLMKKES
jgi:sulfite reductase alpha subunit-like flavoprotein